MRYMYNIIYADGSPKINDHVLGMAISEIQLKSIIYGVCFR